MQLARIFKRIDLPSDVAKSSSCGAIAFDSPPRIRQLALLVVIGELIKCFRDCLVRTLSSSSRYIRRIAAILLASSVLGLWYVSASRLRLDATTYFSECCSDSVLLRLFAFPHGSLFIRRTLIRINRLLPQGRHHE